jgi:Flp pilus assembly protein TadG
MWWQCESLTVREKSLVLKKLFNRRLLRDDRGVTAIEFAMVAPVFLVALGAVLETGVLLFSEYVLQSSVQEAARKIRTGQAQTASMTAADFKTEICKLASIVMDCNGKVQVYVRADADFAALQTAVPSYLAVGNSYGGGGASVTSYNCGQPSQAVAVIATFDWKLIMPGMTAFGNVDGNTRRRVAGLAMFRNEPFPAGTACG